MKPTKTGKRKQNRVVTKATKSPSLYGKVTKILEKNDMGSLFDSNFYRDEYMFYKLTNNIPSTTRITGEGTYVTAQVLEALKKKGILHDSNRIKTTTYFTREVEKECKGGSCAACTPTKMVYMVEKDIMMVFEYDDYTLIHSKNANQNTIDNIVAEIGKILKTIPKERRLYLIDYSKSCGYSFSSFEIQNPTEDKLDLYYNDDLKEVDAKILAHMQDETKSGLFIFHGIPGTGKTTFIRHLIANTERKVFFVPQKLAQKIGEPEFISFLIRNSGCILVIEDSEKFLSSREGKGGSFVGNLLNLTDGLLGDCLKMQVICTFNTDLEKIDQALLRKGRLLAKYDFKELSVEKSNALLSKVHAGKKENAAYETKKPMSLAEIFNAGEEVNG